MVAFRNWTTTAAITKEEMMRKNLSILSVVFLLAFAAQALAQAKEPVKEPVKEQPKEVNISGAWDMVTQTPNGDRPGEATFTQEKETLKITMSGPQGMPMTGEGTVKEGVVQWSVTISGPNGDFTIFFKGKIDGEKMSGEVQAGDFGAFTWYATKKKK
jgi:hypothetical protein